MFFIDVFRNYFNSLVGVNQEFEQLLAAKDISAVKNKMVNRFPLVKEARDEYDNRTHKVMMRQDKIVHDKKGNRVRTEKVWRLPIPYPVYINEIALVFLYGRPPKWIQTSDNTDRAFERYLDVLKKTHFNAKWRQCKRVAGAETESALLFHVFRNDEGKADVQCRVLAASKGDEIYTRWDQYENLLSVGWGYYLTEAENKVVYHFDVFMDDKIYRCTQAALGWEVKEEQNLIGKIPIIVFHQEKEWNGVEQMIDREEHIISHTADTNDYYADPTMVVSADLIKNMPQKQDDGKIMITNDSDGVDKAVRYLTWDSAPESKKQELEWLQDHILSKSFTPKITLDTMKSVSQLSAKALRTVMMLAEIKADRHKEVHDELLDRAASLVKAIIGNVLDVSLHTECEDLQIEHEWQEPFGDDIAEALENVVKAVDAGILSTESALELNPLVKNPATEKERLDNESEQAAERQQQLFANADAGTGSSYTGEDD